MAVEAALQAARLRHLLRRSPQLHVFSPKLWLEKRMQERQQPHLQYQALWQPQTRVRVTRHLPAALHIADVMAAQRVAVPVTGEVAVVVAVVGPTGVAQHLRRVLLQMLQRHE